jgi:hypothetical protein
MPMFSLVFHFASALQRSQLRTLLVLTASDQNLFQKQIRFGLRDESLAIADVMASM